MTIIVKHRRTSKEYILLSINGEVAQANPSRFISELFNQEKSEVSCSATVCDVQGNIFLAYIDDLIVTEIDGQKPASILPEPTYESLNNDLDQHQGTEFEDDEEFTDDNFDEDPEEDPVVSSTPKTSFIEGLGSPIQSDTDDDDDDWV